jgi:signal transduction histidine kinase
MERLDTIDTSPFALAGITEIIDLPAKKLVIMLRWPVAIICSYLLVNPHGKEFEPGLVHLLIPLYLLSNVGLNYLNEDLFESSYFYVPLVIFDILFLTASLIISGQTDTDFYLAYFLIIMLSAMIQDFRGLLLIAVSAAFIYAFFLFRTAQALDSSHLLRVPFLFLVAGFCGYFAQLVRKEKALAKARIYQIRAELLNVMSHELRTPVNIITGCAWVLLNKTLGEINAQQAEIVERVMRNGKELTELINTLLEAASLETGSLTANINEFDLRVFLDDLRIYYGMAPAKETVLIWDYPSDLPVIKTDKLKLKMVLQNLINNGVKFTEKGNVTVSVRHLADAERVEFKVIDTGVGIPKESFGDIFEIFHQSDSSTTRAVGGLGLGLHLVKAFTEILGGTVSVESEPAKGTTFTVTIPSGS